MNETSAYRLLCEAREHLGKAHDKIADAVMNHRGGHHNCVNMTTCSRINDLIEQLHDACGACPLEKDK